HNVQKVVLDPVMVAKSGAKLIKDEAIETIKDALFPLSTVITPNLPEAETLLGTNISDQSEMEAAARKLLDLGPHAVLLKGGHFSNQKSVDCLVLNAPDENGNDLYWYKSERIHTKNTHGTGCTLSSAIAAGLAKGMKLPESVQEAKNYITEAIAAGSEYRLGQGHGPLHHFYQSWD
ncbi:MAG TPA: bifunctional hydroxymethylpyrimidine kinase/phosphomethylpyrimidine kinase, partial [Balneolaceae bacterium]|nr:bifunctional hydroxymethylpyrimidine kinase/phosphomethylpyrimidine kinase [Balneolaceae bacterium]